MHPQTLIAENRTTINQHLFNEGMRSVENSLHKKYIQKLILGLIVLYVIVVIWLLSTGGSLILLFGQTIFLAAILFWLAVLLPRTKRRNKYNAMTKNTGNLPERTIKFYANHLSVTVNSGKTTEILYNDVCEYLETKNLYILKCSDKNYLMINKSGFTLGNFDVIKPHLNITQKK